MHIDVLVNAGIPPAWTVGEPGAHGAGTTGVHGIGVSAPRAAAVAAATIGFAMLVHMPNGMMFVKGIVSAMLATGWLPAINRFTGSTISIPGARPNVHCVDARFVTS